MSLLTRRKGEDLSAVCAREVTHVKVVKKLFLFVIPYKVAVTLSSLERAVIKQANWVNVKQINADFFQNQYIFFNSEVRKDI